MNEQFSTISDMFSEHPTTIAICATSMALIVLSGAVCLFRKARHKWVSVSALITMEDIIRYAQDYLGKHDTPPALLVTVFKKGDFSHKMPDLALPPMTEFVVLFSEIDGEEVKKTVHVIFTREVETALHPETHKQGIIINR